MKFAVIGRVNRSVLSSLDDRTRTAVRRAGSEALRAAQAQAVRIVRERRAMRAKDVREALSLRGPTASPDGEAVSWYIRVSNQPMRVRAYPHKQTSGGVMAQIKAGGWSYIRGAFIATMPRSGHKGVFVRTGEYGRRGDPTLEKIRELWTTKVLDVFRDPDFVEKVGARAKAVFRESFRRNYLAGGAKK